MTLPASCTASIEQASIDLINLNHQNVRHHPFEKRIVFKKLF